MSDPKQTALDYLNNWRNALVRITNLEEENERLREAPQWIPVSERLPDGGVVVVVPLLFAEIQSAKLVNGKWCEAFGKQPILNAAGGLMEFEKWYPLPALEKADE